jgi:transcriptional regulator with XRE-family HTH domain
MRGISQKALGKMAGVTFQQVQKYEKAINRISAGRLYDFSRILDVEVSYFYDEYNPDVVGENGFAEDCEGFQYAPAMDTKSAISLVGAFNRIADPAVRKNLITLINTLSSSEEIKEK